MKWVDAGLVRVSFSLMPAFLKNNKTFPPIDLPHTEFERASHFHPHFRGRNNDETRCLYQQNHGASFFFRLVSVPSVLCWGVCAAIVLHPFGITTVSDVSAAGGAVTPVYSFYFLALVWVFLYASGCLFSNWVNLIRVTVSCRMVLFELNIITFAKYVCILFIKCSAEKKHENLIGKILFFLFYVIKLIHTSLRISTFINTQLVCYRPSRV